MKTKKSESGAIKPLLSLLIIQPLATSKLIGFNVYHLPTWTTASLHQAG